MDTFAKNTNASTDRSKSEIERTLARYGADSFPGILNWQCRGCDCELNFEPPKCPKCGAYNYG